jgi:hypothetical protein
MLLFTNKYVVEDIMSRDVAFCWFTVVCDIAKECRNLMFRVTRSIFPELRNSEHGDTTLFRNVGDYLSRCSIAFQKTWTFRNTAAKTWNVVNVDEGGWVRQNTTVVGSYLLVWWWRHVSAVLGHLQVTSLFTINSSKEKTYTWDEAYLGVVRICGIQWDLIVNRIFFTCNWLKLYKYKIRKWHYP